MKTITLNALQLGGAQKLTRAEMKNILGGVLAGGGTTLSCSCRCNSGIGTQPSFTTVVSNYNSNYTYTPGAANCGCSSLYFTTQPGYNGGSCSVIYSA